VTNLTGTASININGTVGATTATTGAFTTLSATAATFTDGSGATPLALKTTNNTTFVTSYTYNTSSILGYIGNGTGIIGSGNTDFGIRSEGDLILAAGGGTVRGRLTSTGLNSTVIGATTPAAGSFTTLGATTGEISGASGFVTAFKVRATADAATGVGIGYKTTTGAGYVSSQGPYSLELMSNGVVQATISSTGLAVTGTLSATGTTTVGVGGTGATDGIAVLNGSSASNQGAYINFQKNSVDKIYIGTGSSIAGGTLDSLCLSALAGSVTTYANGTKVSDIDKDKSLALQGAVSQTGTGITFPATQNASADANTLDDYEEGTWTPSLVCGTSGTITLSSPTNTGLYTRVGRQVTVIVLASVSSVSSPVGTLNINGFPFANGSATRVPATVFIQNGETTTTASTSYIVESASGAVIFTRVALGAYSSNASDMVQYTDVYFEATYFV
jgi:hypothetical protein